MESLNFHNIKMEKSNAILRYKKRQRMTTLFRFIEFSIFFVVITRFSAQLPLNLKLSTDYFKGFGVNLISPPFVFVLVNAIVIILFFKSGHDGSTDNVKIDLYDEYNQKYSMNKEAYCEQSKKQSVLVEEVHCEQSKMLYHEREVQDTRPRNPGNHSPKSIATERRLEKRIHRSRSDNALNSSLNEKKTRKRMVRSATVGCLKVIDTDSVKPATTKMTTTLFPEDGMSNDEFWKTIEAFIARQQRLVREEEFSIST